MAKQRARKRSNPSSTCGLESREWEAALPAFADASVEGFVLFDRDLNLLGMNPSAIRLVGVSDAQVNWALGRNLEELVPTIKSTGRDESYRDVLQTGRPFLAGDVPVPTLSGEARIDVKAFKVGDGLGVLISDVTERVKLGEALQRSEDIYRAIVETSPDGIYQVDASGNFLFVNESFASMFGYTREELVGRHFSLLVAAHALPDVTAMVEEVLTGNRVRDEVLAIHRDGHGIPVAFGAAPLRRNGTIVGMTGVLRDITERTRAEEALRESEERYRTLVENSLVGICVHVGNEIVFINDRAIEILGGDDTSQFKGRSVLDFVNPEFQDAVRERLQMVTSTGSAPLVEERLVKLDGAVIDVELAGASIAYQGQHATQVVFRDITERKRAERLAGAQQELSRHMSETSDLEQGLRACLEIALLIAEMDSGGVYLVDETTGALELIVHHGLDPEFVRFVSRFDAGEPNMRLVVDGKPLFTKHADLGLPDDEARRREGLRATAVIPVCHENQVIACLNVASHVLDEVPEYSRNILLSIARQMGNAIARLKAEAALQKSEQEKALVLSSVSELIAHLDADMRIRWTNRAAAASVNMDPADLVGRRCFEVWQGRSEPCSECPVLKSLKSGRAEEGEMVTPDGRAWSVHGYPLLDEAGQVFGAVEVTQNITERRRAEEELRRHRSQLEGLVGDRTRELTLANERLREEILEHQRTEERLRESEERSRMVAEAMPIPVLISRESDGLVLYANESLCSAVGIERDQIASITALSFYVNPEDRRIIVDTLQAEGRVRDHEVEVKKADGTTIWAIATIEPLVFQGERCLLSGLYEITERQEIEAKLQHQEEYFRSLIENSTEVFIVLNADGTIRYESPSMERISGYDPAERVGASILDMIHPEDLPVAIERLKELLETPTLMTNIEVRARHKDGTYRHIEGTGQNLLHDPAVAGIVVNYRDVSERRNAQKKLQELYEQEKALRQQLEAEMNRRVDFTRALAHELKTPLTPMVISSQVLESHAVEEPLLSLAKNISRGAQNLNSRIDELLDMAKGEIGMLQLHDERLDMAQLLREALDDVSPVAASRSLSLESDLPDGPLPLRGDRGRLRQIVLNLLNNAVKFTPEGGVVTLQARLQGESLLVEVKDTGPGLPKAGRSHLFEPYQRLDGGDKLSGLGLGLYLCKMLVELHGGRIWAKSRPGKGSAFGFSIPLNRST